MGLPISQAGAQEFPTKPITMVVPFAAGGPTDVVGRKIGHLMERTLKQPIVIQNAGGAGGTIGTNLVNKAKADGYTILLHHIGMATAPALYRKLDFNPLTDFEYIGLVADVPMTLVAKQGLPANNFNELLSYIKVHQDKLTLANAGLGSASHLCGMVLMESIGVDLTTVPYKGTQPAMTDLLAGQVDIMCDQVSNTLPFIKDKKVKVYATSTPKRLKSLPEVPSATEIGLPKFNILVWHGIYAPKNTPPAMTAKIRGALQEALKTDEFQKDMDAFSITVSTPAEATEKGLKSILEADTARLGVLIRKAGQFAD